MVNEVLCKLVCHNLCVLIQETHELGIEAEFWKPNPAVEVVCNEISLPATEMECLS